MTRQAVSAACLLLGAKVEEVTKPVKDVVKAILYVRYKHSKPELEAAMVRTLRQQPCARGWHTALGCSLFDELLRERVEEFAVCGKLMGCCMPSTSSSAQAFVYADIGRGARA